MALDNDASTPQFVRGIVARITDPSARAFATLLLTDAGEGLTAFDGAALALEAMHAFAVASERPRGRHVIEARRTSLRRADTMDEAGQTFTILAISNDDMPFLVDSVAGELQAQGLAAHLLLHPILKVRRDPAGRIERILGSGDRNWGDGTQESFMLIVLDALSDRRAEELVTDLSRVLDDVRVAVTDWQSMVARLDRAITTLESSPPAVPPGLLAEALAFCRWLRDGQFTFLGMREVRLASDGSAASLETVPGSALGVLRDSNARTLSRNRAALGLSPEVHAYLASTEPLVVSKSNLLSRVHRRVHMDYIGLKSYGPDGAVTGELRMVGLFTSQAYTQPPQRIPLVRNKVEAVVAASGYPPQSHAGKAIANILDNFPRDELFQIPAEELGEWAAAILDLDIRPRLRVLLRHDQFQRFVSALVFVPRDRFSTRTREKIGDVLADAFNGRVSSFTPFFTEGPLVRVHFVIGRNEGPPTAATARELEARIAIVIRTWDDQLADSLRALPGEGPALVETYRTAFSLAYMGTFEPTRALTDIARIEKLTADRPIGIDFYRDPQDPPSRVRAAIYRLDMPVPLSERVPVLENLGFSVIDERSYRVIPAGGQGRREVALHDMMLETADGAPIELDRHDVRMEDTFLAVSRGAADSDGFNRLIVAAGADWREAAVLRALAAYMRQIRLPFGSRYISDVLVMHAGVARDLIELFRTRFDPEGGEENRSRHAGQIMRRLEGALAAVPSLDEDRILRACLGLVSAILRTNYFQSDSAGRPPDTLAFKFDPARIDGLPEPRPFREIFVYSPRVEGVHLRFEPIARGGIRWSDRAQDFRTEVLGLCKAQQVKNTVIVPSGAKGGFLPKKLPRTGGRDDFQREGTAAYRIFISSLLAITDNIVDGLVVPPQRVVRHEGDDPYLVVAADKGTATFSDLANSIAAEHGFWMGDAFASGGSAGYDHKKMGITARGAWECVKRHFRERNIDIQTMPFRVAGVGDMSGDVFGNGMLLSRHIRLVAAFDHRDIFIDPDPDPAASHAERARLFALPRSSWHDYDAVLLSKGGGVFSRQAKAIPVSGEMAALLGIAAGEAAPAVILRAILMLDVDLLWFGGIGTYIRATTETDDQAGDRANDGWRITAADVRAAVIGEGANLAVTQRGRVEAASRGIALNTDFIDNSAGVNSSDIEVNIKIALAPAVTSGRLTIAERNILLARMTDDVAGQCLVANYQQSLAISLAERAGAAEIGSAARLMRALEARGLLDRRLEALPSDGELAARESAMAGLTRPEIAVLLSWSKIALSREILAGPAPDDPACQDLLRDYFPRDLRERFADDISRHRLSREIVATRITNSMINRGGPAFAVRLADETGRSATEIAYAYLAVRRMFDLPIIWAEIDALDGKISGGLQLELYEATRSLVIGETKELLHSVGSASISAAASRYRAAVTAIGALLDDILPATQMRDLSRRSQGYCAQGVPDSLARRIAALAFTSTAPQAADIAQATNSELAAAASALFAAESFLRLDELEARAATMRLGDYYDRLAVAGAIGGLEAASRALASAALARGETFSAWLARDGKRLDRAKAALDEIAAVGELTVSRLVVAAAQVRDLAAG